MPQQIEGKPERRFISGAQIRAKKGDTPGIEGYGAVFNEQFDTGWGMIETILPGAFTRALKEKQDVRCLFNHNPDNLLGRTKSGTLHLQQDDHGLLFDCDSNPDARVASDVQAMVDRGDLDGCSFAFIVRECTWREEKDDKGITTFYRDISDVDLFDVGPVTYPAYEGTSVGARSFWPGGIPTEVRSRLPRLPEEGIVPSTRRDASDVDDGDICDCSCDPCKEGRCEDCSCEGDCEASNCSAEDCRCGAAARMRMRLRMAEASL